MISVFGLSFTDILNVVGLGYDDLLVLALTDLVVMLLVLLHRFLHLLAGFIEFMHCVEVCDQISKEHPGKKATTFDDAYHLALHKDGQYDIIFTCKTLNPSSF